MNTRNEKAADYDVVIIGAGFGGLAALYHLRQAGHRCLLLEAGDDVGGTWYWNHYPGARTDTEAWVYAYSFAPQILRSFRWRHRYPSHGEVQGYLRFVAEELDLLASIEFRHRVEALTYDADAGWWQAQASNGAAFTATVAVTAVGSLSHPYLPDIPGLSSFRGQVVQSARWPQGGVQWKDKRVGLVGTGSTGVQLVPALAGQVSELYVFQRTPEYVIDGRDEEISDARWNEILAGYEQIWELARNNPSAFPFQRPTRSASEASAEERERVFEAGWQRGGFHFQLTTFADLGTNPESNEMAADFIRRKIRAKVTDPQVAELLCPKGYPFGSRRPPVGENYYETYNRPNVHLVDVSRAPISKIDSERLWVGDTGYELDAIVFATGFDSFTGALNAIDISGPGGTSLRESWRDGPHTHTGVATAGFPNLFFVYGPQTPLSNIPVTVQNTAEWITALLSHMSQQGFCRIEAQATAEQEWLEELHAAFRATIFGSVSQREKSWFMGGNIPGKPVSLLGYVGGANKYYERMDQLARDGYPGFEFK